MPIHITGWFLCLLLLLSACGGGGGGGSSGGQAAAPTVPGVPTGLTVNAGDQALSLGWSAPAANGGSAISGYQVEIIPRPLGVDIQLSGTRALVRNLSNGVNYQLSVAAINRSGTGDASAAVTAQPKAADRSAYSSVTIAGDPVSGSESGIYDPALLRASNDDLWLAYSAVHFYNNSGDIIQDVGTRIARSNDNGISFQYQATVFEPAGVTVTDTDPMRSACGGSSCAGRWVYETSTLIEDPTDPDPNRRFKLFASKYFIYPDSPSSKTLYHLGAIVMSTASTPDASWSTETVVLDWPLSPPELPAGQDVTALDAALGNCILVAEAGAAVVDGQILMALVCPYLIAPSTIVQKIVLLRSTDHAASFSYVSTLLTPADAPAGVDYFSAPSLIARQDNAPVLLVTAVESGTGVYRGSRVFPLSASDDDVFRVLSMPQSILSVPLQTPGILNIGGASSYARDTGNLGILQSDALVGSPLDLSQFRIMATRIMIEQ